jgi:hypothetical protein
METLEETFTLNQFVYHKRDGQKFQIEGFLTDSRILASMVCFDSIGDTEVTSGLRVLGKNEITGIPTKLVFVYDEKLKYIYNKFTEQNTLYSKLRQDVIKLEIEIKRQEGVLKNLEDNWRPASSAFDYISDSLEKNGFNSDCILASNGREQKIIWYTREYPSDGAWVYGQAPSDYIGNFLYFTPTHWMPLPKDPAEFPTSPKKLSK